MATLEATPRAPLQIKRPTRRYSQGAYAFVALGTAERHYPTTRRCAIFRKRMEFQKKKKRRHKFFPSTDFSGVPRTEGSPLLGESF